MNSRFSVLGSCVALLVFGICLPVCADEAETITITTKPSKASRPGHISATIDKSGKLNIVPAVDTPLTHQGVIKVDGETFRIYLPATANYSLKNTGPGEGQFENNSTLLS